MTVELERPLRFPDTGSAALMNKRARWLVVLGVLLPGSAQLLAGSRRLGRVGLGATITLIVLGLVTLAGILWARETTLSILLNPIVLLAVQLVIVAYAILWLVLGFDTLRLTRLVRLSPGWRMPLAALSVILTLVPVGAAAWAATTIQAARGAIGDIFVSDAPAVAPVDGRYNILLLGVDAGADRDGLRPDSISLVSVDAETGQSVIVGLPRELPAMPFTETSPMHDIHPNGFCQGPNAFGEWGGCLTGYLNGVFGEVEQAQVIVESQGLPQEFADFYSGMYADATSRGSSPGIEATKDAVAGATGLEVQFYVLIDMEGFSSLIDALGGVTIDVRQPIPIGGYEDPSTGEWVMGDAYIQPGIHQMDGETALLFARVRHGLPNGDYDRMEHQRQLQAAILAQMNPTNVLLRFQEIAATGSAIVRTDISDSMLGTFVDLAAKAREYAPVMVQLTPPAIIVEAPDYAEVHRLVVEGVAAASPAPEPDEGE